MTLSDYNSIVESDYLLSTKANRAALGQALNELDNGEVQDY